MAIRNLQGSYMSEFKCPLCKQPVSEELFEKITGIWKERRAAEKRFKEQEKELVRQKKETEKQLEAEKKRLRTEQKSIIEQKLIDKTKKYDDKLQKMEIERNKLKERFDKRIAIAIKTAEAKAKREINQELKVKMQSSIKKEVEKVAAKTQKSLFRANQTIEATRKQMTTLQAQNMKQQERIKNLETQLKNQTTPQLEGLLYEDQLLEALKREFVEDKFEHTGKGGDIIQIIILDNKSVGTIVFECKRVGQWQTAHAEQAANAKIQRKACYALLVTNASKKGGGGFFVEKGVIVVHPGGVLAITRILREQLLEIARMKLTQAQREEAIEKVYEYLQGAEFKNSIDIVIRKTIEMYEDLKKECQDHIKVWEKRYETLKLIHLNSAAVKVKTRALISGKTVQTEELAIPEFPALPDLTNI